MRECPLPICATSGTLNIQEMLFSERNKSSGFEKSSKKQFFSREKRRKFWKIGLIFGEFFLSFFLIFQLLHFCRKCYFFIIYPKFSKFFNLSNFLKFVKILPNFNIFPNFLKCSNFSNFEKKTIFFLFEKKKFFFS